MTFDVPFIRPVMPKPKEVSKDLEEIISANWFTNFGPKERLFSTAIADYVGGGTQSVTFANATLGLIAAISVLLPSSARRRFVLVPSFTFAAGPAAIEWAGYEPLFLDIDEDSLQPSLASATSAMNQYGQDVAGILLCNTFGIGNRAVKEWETFAQSHFIPLIIDSAAGFGSLYPGGQRVGSAGTCEVFSFHATKPFAIGEGGAVLSRDSDLADRMRAFSNFGFDGTNGATMLGLNGKLQEINAAIGLRQLKSFEVALQDRRSTFKRLSSSISSTEYRFPEGIEDSSLCFVSALLPTNAAREKLLARLRARRIEARCYYSPAVHLQPQFANSVRAGNLDNTRRVAETVISIPLHQSMADQDVESIVEVLNDGS